MPSRPSTRPAFTLVELIAILVVLAVLSAVAVPRLFDFSAKAKAASIAASFKTIAQASWEYRATNGGWPTGTWWAQCPPPLEPFIEPTVFSQRPPIGDSWVWEYSTGWPVPYFGIYGASISTADHAVFAKVDKTIDNNDVATGRIQTLPDWIWYDFDAN